MATTKRKISELDPLYSQEGHDNKRPRPASPDDASSAVDHKLSYPSRSFRSHDIRPVTFQQPTPLVTFSYNSSRVLEFNNSSLRYHVDPPPGADLKYGYDRWIRRPEEKGRIDGLLKAYMKVREKNPGASLNGGVVAWRGVMTRILTAPYEDRDGWELNVMRVDGTLYFEEHVSDAKLREKEDMAPHHRIQTYYGYSFESFCTSSTPDLAQQGGWGGDVDTNVQWCSVVKTKLGDTRLLIGGEVDCVRGKLTNDNKTLVELKTSLTIRGPQDEARFEKKLLKFYFQSFLLGVPEIVVGFRTPAGKLTTVQSFKTMQIPRMVRDKPDAWDPSICLDWGQRLLTFLKSFICQGGQEPSSSNNVWRVKFVPRTGISLSLLDDKDVNEVRAGEDDRLNGFLPNWYWDEIQKDMIIRKQTSERSGDVGRS